MGIQEVMLVVCWVSWWRGGGFWGDWVRRWVRAFGCWLLVNTNVLFYFVLAFWWVLWLVRKILKVLKVAVVNRIEEILLCTLFFNNIILWLFKEILLCTSFALLFLSSFLLLLCILSSWRLDFSNNILSSLRFLFLTFEYLLFLHCQFLFLDL